MKKVLTVLLAGIMLLSLVACDGGGKAVTITQVCDDDDTLNDVYDRLAINNDYDGFWDAVRAYIDNNICDFNKCILLRNMEKILINHQISIIL